MPTAVTFHQRPGLGQFALLALSLPCFPTVSGAVTTHHFPRTIVACATGYSPRSAWQWFQSPNRVMEPGRKTPGVAPGPGRPATVKRCKPASVCVTAWARGYTSREQSRSRDCGGAARWIGCARQIDQSASSAAQRGSRSRLPRGFTACNEYNPTDLTSAPGRLVPPVCRLDAMTMTPACAALRRFS